MPSVGKETKIAIEYSLVKDKDPSWVIEKTPAQIFLEYPSLPPGAGEGGLNETINYFSHV